MSSFSSRSAATSDDHEPVTLAKSVVLSHVPKPAQVSIASSTTTESSDGSLHSTDMNNHDGVVDNMVLLPPSNSIVTDKSIPSVQDHRDEHIENKQDSPRDSLARTNKLRITAVCEGQQAKSSPDGPDAHEAKNHRKREVSSVDNELNKSDLSPILCVDSNDLRPLKKKARGNDTKRNQEPSLGAVRVVPPSATSSTLVIPNGVAETAQAAVSPILTLLLARPTDDAVLSPLHSFARKQIEVFTATQADLNLPSPGRKNPIQLHQVGLRCIHCRHLPFRDRVKRAVCYPSSLGRVYHSASDMKFDHFSSCKALPENVRAEFQRLKNGQRSSHGKKPSRSSGSKGGGPPAGCSSSTAQYYHDCACQMGMVDRQGGVFFSMTSIAASTATASALHANKLVEICRTEPAPPAPRPAPHMMTAGSTANTESSTLLNGQFLIPEEHIWNRTATMPMLSPIMQQAMFQRVQQQLLFALMTTNRASASPHAPVVTATDVISLEQPPATNKECASSKTPSTAPQDQGTEQGQLYQQAPSCIQDHQAGPAAASTTSGMILSSPLDPQYLNPIHCFVRRHVEFFAATTEDITAPSPGRRTRVLAGQVGLRCVHCARLPVKERVKRAVCYPPSVNGIYHCVSNMKFDHFAICRGLPAQDRQEFLALRESSQGNPRRTAAAPTASSSSSSSTKKNGKNGGGVKCTGNSTFRYYHDSALRMGLVDTDQGIRLVRDVERTILENKNQEHRRNCSETVADKEVAVAPEAKIQTRSAPMSVEKKQDGSAGKVDMEEKIESSINPHASDGMTALMIAASTCPKAAV